MTRHLMTLTALALALSGSAAAQERTAGQAMDAQVNWSALQNSIDLVSNQNKALAAMLDKMNACNAKKMLFAPSDGAADANGCVSTGGGSVQVGTVTDTTSFSNRNLAVKFAKPFSSVPQVYLALNRYYYHDNCRQDRFLTSMGVSNITKTGFTLTMGGSGTCGGEIRVEGVTWIAIQN